MAAYITLARPYAKAAFEYAKSANLVDSWKKQLVLSAGIALVPKVANAFSSPDKDNEQLVAILVGDTTDTGYKNLISLMAENNRLALLPDVVTAFKYISEQDENLLSADVYTAEKLSDKQMQRISAAITKRTGKTVKLSQHLDKSLLSGARIVAGDLVIDGSLKTRFEKLKTDLLN